MLSKIKLFFRKPYWKDKLALSIFLVSLFINIALWIYLRMAINPTSEAVILHYTIYFGPDDFGEYFQIFNIALVGSFLLIVNTILSDFIYPRKKIVALFLIGSNFLAQIFLFIGGIAIVMINQ